MWRMKIIPTRGRNDRINRNRKLVYELKLSFPLLEL